NGGGDPDGAIWALYGRFFFFQAEDGIRDYKVTGVQTCALPICVYPHRIPDIHSSLRPDGAATAANRTATASQARSIRTMMPRLRSEERRVGKECRSR